MKLNIRKSKASYTVMIISDSGEKGSKTFHVRAGLAGMIIMILFVLFVAVICYSVYISIILFGAKESNRLQQEQFRQLNEAYIQLEGEKEELEGKISALSSQLEQRSENAKLVAAVKEDANIPKGFPADGAAYFNTEEDGDAGTRMKANSRRKEIIFAMAAESNVVSSGAGTVQSVSTDSNEGNIISIDHGNGYVTMYRSFNTPMVEKDAKVAAGDILYEADENGLEVGYSIRKDDVYVDPMEMMKIDG